MKNNQRPHQIVIVGGGAGGLELATKLGNTLGKKQDANITLVDSNLTHIWKPLWHEVAAGTLTSGEDELNYIVHGSRHHFIFTLGRLQGIDRQQRQIILAAVKDQAQQQILPERILSYDSLIIAIGSISHDFAMPGVKEHCHFLDSHADSADFHQLLLKNLLRLQAQLLPHLNIAIIGGGATGIELAAELQFACQQALDYGQPKAPKPSPIQISVIENSPRILPALPEKISSVTRQELQRRGIQVFEGEHVSQITAEGIVTDKGLAIPATLKIWAAGIKAPAVLATLGLETNQRHQLIVKQTLQTTIDDNIFAFGDCAHCPQPNSANPVPPRAQAAHQQATLLAKSLGRRLKNQPLLPYSYRDYGSLVTLSKNKTVGSLMGKHTGSIFLEGKLARLAYLFLYRHHQAALYGWPSVILLSLAQLLTSRVRARLKLH